ncbi:MAG: BatD family protein, partial [Proteobacteria bacterium]|nr:BatD family protein [Pseudomonadota bacterium]
MRASQLFAITIAMISCCAAPLAVRAADPDVETSVHASTVAPGDPITLRIRLRGAAASSEPDLGPLDRDFEVLDVHQSHQTSIINGVRDESVDYTVALVARREGDLVIPALPVGDTATDPVPVEVSARAGDVADRDAEPDVPTAPVLLE